MKRDDSSNDTEKSVIIEVERDSLDEKIEVKLISIGKIVLVFNANK